MMDHPLLRPIKDNQKRKTSQIVLWALAEWHWRQIVDRGDCKCAWRRNALRGRISGQSYSSRHIPASVAAFFASAGSADLSLRRGYRLAMNQSQGGRIGTDKGHQSANEQD
jgi:hypothetical protein